MGLLWFVGKWYSIPLSHISSQNDILVEFGRFLSFDGCFIQLSNIVNICSGLCRQCFIRQAYQVVRILMSIVYDLLRLTMP